MIVHLFKKYILNHNWITVSNEVMLIVLLSYFSLQVNNCNDYRIAQVETNSRVLNGLITHEALQQFIIISQEHPWNH